MKFAMSYSCGKDSTLALHRMIAQGHEPVCLVVMVNKEAGRSYFHGADPAMLDRYAGALDLPMVTCPAAGESYQSAFEAGLARAKGLGAEAAAFGDIDLEPNRRWEEDRCAAVGLTACFPLWQQGRRALVEELVGLGYRCLIKSVNKRLLPESLLGRCIDQETIAAMEAAGVDACGENGEYHTLAMDGPVFRRPLEFQTGEVVDLGGYAVLDVRCRQSRQP